MSYISDYFDDSSCFKIEGRWLLKFDHKYSKWNRCGEIVTIEDRLYYVTLKREILYMHKSLGVSRSILRFLLSLPNEVTVYFKLGFNPPYTIYTVSARVLYDEGIEVKTENDLEGVTMHLPLSRLNCRTSEDDEENV